MRYAEGPAVQLNLGTIVESQHEEQRAIGEWAGEKTAKRLATSPTPRTFAPPSPTNAWVKAASESQSVQLTQLAPQHLGLEIGRVASGRATRGLERFTQVAQQPLDGVSLDDERCQLEPATAGATLNVNLERSLH